ncbi:MAG: type I glyceraldehyde-3-phosphate dehydrogenase [Chitinophagales bacterium]|nr:type I glyceraldehyde-3-phosphate dehydrogenase [Chitinophagales bacterium]
MAKKRIAINGMGRIGRLLLKILLQHDSVEVVAINDLSPDDDLQYLIKYDTAQRNQPQDVRVEGEYLVVNGHKIQSFAIADPLQLPWKDLNIDIVVECTGIFRKREKLEMHLTAGAKKVVLSAPAKGDIKTVVIGINEDIITPEDTILSNASCTTNCLAPMVQVLDELCGIDHAIMNTVHAYTGDQNLQDAIHKSDMRRARAAAENIVPTTSNATSTLEIIIPKMKGKLTGGAVRVPVMVGSLTELYANVARLVTKDEINQAFLTASQGKLNNILAYNTDPIVSSDIIGNTHSCIFDADLTIVMGNLVKITGWYDNEFGYASRLAELVEMV